MPLIPIILGVVAVAALIYLLTERIVTHNEFNSRVDLIKAGKLPPGSLPGPTPTLPESVSKLGMWLALGAIVVVVGPKLLEKRSA